MTLEDRIKLVNDLVRENPDVTIKEYLEAVGEIDVEVEGIAAASISVIIPAKDQPLFDEWLNIRKRSPNKINPKYIKTYRIGR
jgi:hypothetical protein